MGVQRNIFWPRPLGPGEGQKKSSIIKFQLQRQFQRYLTQTLCVFSQIERFITFLTRFSFSHLGYTPGAGLMGTGGGDGGVNHMYGIFNGTFF